MPVRVSAEEPIDNTCGENLTWTFDSNSGKLTIQGTGDMDAFSLSDFEFVNVPTGYTDDYFCGKPVNKSSDVPIGDITTITYERNETIVCENHNLTDGICTICGAYISHVHSIDSGTGVCTSCGKKPGRAKLTDKNGSYIAEYDSITAAMVAANGGNGQRVYALSSSDESFTIKSGISFYGDVYELS